MLEGLTSSNLSNTKESFAAEVKEPNTVKRKNARVPVLSAKVAKDNVCVIIGTQGMTFNKKKLQCLEYFEKALSGRWCDINSDVIRLAAHSKFGVADLKLLLICVEAGRIVCNPQRPLSLSQIDSLLHCANYFCAGPNSHFCKRMLINYFQHRKPPMTASIRKKWLIESTNKVVREALFDFDQLLTKQVACTRAKFVHSNLNNSLAGVKHSKQIKYDSDFAAALFKQKFKIRIDKCLQLVENAVERTGGTGSRTHEMVTKLKISIEGFDKDLFEHLYKLFDIGDYWHLLGSDVADIVDHLVHWTECDKLNQVRRKSIECDPQIRDAVDMILRDSFQAVVNEANGANGSNKLNVADVPHGVTAYSLLVSRFNLINCRQCFYTQIYAVFGQEILHLATGEKEEFLKLLMDSHEAYYDFGTVAGNIDETDQDMKKRKSTLRSWYQLMTWMLAQCSQRFLVSNANKWFPKLQHTPEWFDDEVFAKSDMTKFIFARIVSKFDTQNAFNFGLYLVDYLMYHKSPLPQEYFNFLQETVGITWDLVS